MNSVIKLVFNKKRNLSQLESNDIFAKSSNKFLPKGAIFLKRQVKEMP